MTIRHHIESRKTGEVYGICSSKDEAVRMQADLGIAYRVGTGFYDRNMRYHKEIKA